MCVCVFSYCLCYHRSTIILKLKTNFKFAMASACGVSVWVMRVCDALM